jgi:predicted nucleotidyltransferase
MKRTTGLLLTKMGMRACNNYYIHFPSTSYCDSIRYDEVTIVIRREFTREAVVKTIVDFMKQLDYVHALYEGGAIAFDRIDEWSDIDLYIVVDDEKVNETFDAVEVALKSLAPIKHKYSVPKLPWPSVSQSFYRLEQTSEYLLIDLAVIKLSSPEKFLEPHIHGKVVFYINKSDEIKVPIMNKEELEENLAQKLAQLRDRFAVFNINVQKEINRGNYLEALILYNSITLGSVVDALRIKYNPFHHDFKTRYVQYELPKQIVRELQRLYFVRDITDLIKKYREGTGWFYEIVKESF